MSIWAEIRHALNSTLGTNKFKPLDQLLLDNLGLIENADKLYASKTFTNLVLGGENNKDVLQKLGNEFAIDCNGTATLQFTFTLTKETSGRTVGGTLYLYKNNDVVKTANFSSGTGELSTNLSIDFNGQGLSRGDKYSVGISYHVGDTSYWTNLQVKSTLKVYAEPTIIGSNFVEVI